MNRVLHKYKLFQPAPQFAGSSGCTLPADGDEFLLSHLPQGVTDTLAGIA